MPLGNGPADGCQRMVVSTEDVDIGGNYEPSLTSRDGGPGWNTGVGSDAFPRQAVQSSDATGAGVAITVDPETTETLAVTDLIISVDTAMSVTIKDNDGTPKTLFKFYMAANSTIQITPRGWLQVTLGKKLIAIASVSGNISITSFYKVIPAAS